MASQAIGEPLAVARVASAADHDDTLRSDPGNRQRRKPARTQQRNRERTTPIHRCGFLVLIVRSDEPQEGRAAMSWYSRPRQCGEVALQERAVIRGSEPYHPGGRMGHESPVNAALARRASPIAEPGSTPLCTHGHTIVSTTGAFARSFAACRPILDSPAVISGVRLWLPTQVPVPEAPVLRVSSDESPANTSVPARSGPQRESHLARSSDEAHRARQRSMNPLQTGRSRPSARFHLTRRMPRLTRTRPHVNPEIEKSIQHAGSCADVVGSFVFVTGWSSSSVRWPRLTSSTNWTRDCSGRTHRYS